MLSLLLSPPCVLSCQRQAAAASLRLDAVTMPGGEPATAAGIMQAGRFATLANLSEKVLVPPPPRACGVLHA